MSVTSGPRIFVPLFYKKRAGIRRKGIAHKKALTERSALFIFRYIDIAANDRPTQTARYRPDRCGRSRSRLP